MRRIKPFGMHQTHRGYEDLAQYRRYLVRYGVAFVLITAICFAVSLISAPETDLPLYLSGWVLALGCVALAWFRPSLWLFAPFGALGGAILVRAGSDGLDAGLGPLLLIPVLAVAVYGSRRALIAVVGSVATAAVIVVQVASAEGSVELTPVWRQDLRPRSLGDRARRRDPGPGHPDEEGAQSR